MLNHLIRWSLRNRAIIICAALLVLALGFKTGGELPVEVLPDLTKPTVVVLTESPGLSPEEVEAFVKDTSPDAYEKLVAMYMARPQWGESVAAMAISRRRCAAPALRERAVRARQGAPEQGDANVHRNRDRYGRGPGARSGGRSGRAFRAAPEPPRRSGGLGHAAHDLDL